MEKKIIKIERYKCENYYNVWINHNRINHELIDQYCRYEFDWCSIMTTKYSLSYLNEKCRSICHLFYHTSFCMHIYTTFHSQHSNIIVGPKCSRCKGHQKSYKMLRYCIQNHIERKVILYTYWPCCILDKNVYLALQKTAPLEW